MSKRKVTILCNQLTGGGVEKVMQDVANYLASKPELYDVTVTVLDGPDEGRELLSDSIRIKGAFRSKAAYKKWSAAWVLFKFKQLFYVLYLMLTKHDILLVVKDQQYLRLGAHIKANVKIAWIHFNYEFFGLFTTKEKLFRYIKSFDTAICVSQLVKDVVISAVGDTGNLVVAYNPLNAEEIVSLANESIEPPSINSKPIFVTVSRLRENKGIMNILQSCKELTKQYDFSLWIVGDGEDRDRLERYVKDNGITNVCFLGWKAKPYPYIKNADWYICASKVETYGLTIFESDIIGTPVLAGKLEVLSECADPNGIALVENSADGILSGMTDILDGRLKIEITHDLKALHKELYTDRISKIEGIINNNQC